MRVLAAAGLLLVGAVTAVATVALHDLWWGLALAAAATVLTTFALPPGWWSRLAFVAGWVLVVGWLTFPRAEGDYVISQDAQGYAVLVLGLVLLVVAIATLPRPTISAGGDGS
ncbi:DUF6113 family protein [Nocardioides sp.]|uniref:DUF6113 family protein n=1 Tax=Nocardioides sp. TaxID=35761 RepID=UPI00378422A4